MKTKITLLLAAFVLPLGCTKDDPNDQGNERIAVQFGAGQITATRTTADGTAWEENDRIGIFMIHHGETLSSEAIAGEADHVEYRVTTGNSAGSSLLPETTPVYYPPGGKAVDFVAYYPYTASVSRYIYAVDVNDQSAPSAIDVLYAHTNADGTHPGYTNQSGSVDLSFSHALSKASFTLSGSGLTDADLAGATLTLSNFYRKAEIDLAEGLVGSLTDHGTLSVHMSGGLSGSALLIPQTVTGSVLTVTLSGGQSFRYAFDITEFKQGRNHPYHITVSKTGIAVSPGDILDWKGKDDSPTPGKAEPVIYYKVGDYYPDPYVDLTNPVEKAKIQGVVYWLDPASDGTHGKIMDLMDFSTIWGSVLYITGATDHIDGLFNMKKIYETTGGNFNNFISFYWINDQKNGGSVTYAPGALGVWYLPAIDELTELYVAWNGMRTTFNSRLTAAGGTGMISSSYYWSSTEENGSNAWAVSFDTGDTYNQPKISACNVRAILAF